LLNTFYYQLCPYYSASSTVIDSSNLGEVWLDFSADRRHCLFWSARNVPFNHSNTVGWTAIGVRQHLRILAPIRQARRCLKHRGANAEVDSASDRRPA